MAGALQISDFTVMAVTVQVDTVHIAGKRYAYRPEKITTVKIYTNCEHVTLYANGKKVATKTGSKVLSFRVTLGEETKLEAVAGDVRDAAVLHFTPDPVKSYKLNKKIAGGGNWT